MTRAERLADFCGLLLDCHRLWHWEYGEGLRLCGHNCPDERRYAGLFAAQAGTMAATGVVEGKDGMAWAVAMDRDRYHVLGPVWLDGAGRAGDTLPVFGARELGRYATMLHRLLAGGPAGDTLLTRLQDRIRQGDYDYKALVLEALTDRRALYELDVVSKDSARQTATLAMAMCRQAAQEAGLSARTLDALYAEHMPGIQATEHACEIALRCNALLYRLVWLVRRARGIATPSDPVQACCAYIEAHANERLGLDALSRQVGYSPDHLSRKFRAEMGEPLKAYVLGVKLHRAQLLLTTTALPIADIAALLAFCSSSHFTRAFHRQVGQTPACYREQYRHAG